MRGLFPYSFSSLLDDDEYVFIEEESEFEKDLEIIDEQYKIYKILYFFDDIIKLTF